MSLMSEGVAHRWKAPSQSGGVLVEPPRASLGGIVAQNVSQRSACDYELHGRSLAQLAAQAKGELVAAAACYSRSYRDVQFNASDAPSRVFLAGHQPEMFHPGVWYKNFLLGGIARDHGAVGVNLVIDSDTIKSASLRVPGGSAAQPTLARVPFDRPSLEIPYEQRQIVDRECFASFGARAGEQLAPLVARPILTAEYWPRVIARANETARIGECLAQARHQLEGSWGLETLELPQSQVCELPSFHWFTAHLLTHLPRLWDIYNAALADYRAAHHVRSSHHPAPPLATDDDWLEAPFWIWTDSDPRRRRLFVRQVADQLELTDRGEVRFEIEATAEGQLDRAVEQLAALGAQGIRLRTRALITTMLARLLLGDLFLHGIGGAKYDRLTDQLIGQFFGLTPPTFVVASATLHLPIEREPAAATGQVEVTRRLRDLQYHPERSLRNGAVTNPDQRALADTLIGEKRRWIDTPATPENAKLRGDAIRAVNRDLQPLLDRQREQLLGERERLAERARSEAILNSREYAFCLYPEADLRKLLG